MLKTAAVKAAVYFLDEFEEAMPWWRDTSVVSYLYLAIAIVAEVIATSMLKSTNGFSKPFPSFVGVLGYCVAFYCLSLTLRSINVGVAYAIWCGAGILLVTLVSMFFYLQTPDVWAVTGMALIIAGVCVIQLMSETTVG